MDPFITVTGLVAPLDRLNVDTDQIIPKQYLKTVKRTGLKEGLFFDWRHTPDGVPDPTFFMNQPRFSGVSILLGRENFGCGSSREHAPWALLDYGIRCVIAPSFADIFYNNCFQNGMLPVVLPEGDINVLFDAVNATKGYQLAVNLDAQTITTPEGKQLEFTIDPFRKSCLLNGFDTIGLTLQHEGDIAAYEVKRKVVASWLFPE